MDECDNCKQLRMQIAKLEHELYFLKNHPALVQGFKGEEIVCLLTGGQRGTYASRWDLTLPSKVKIEVKFSALNTNNKGFPARRWAWSNPLGWHNKGKDYDFLLLVGDKDIRFSGQYPADSSPYVFFLIPYEIVQDVITCGKKGPVSHIQVNTNLSKTPAGLSLKQYIVTAAEVIHLLQNLQAKA